MTSTHLSSDLAAAVEANVLALAAKLVGRTLDAPAALRPLHDLGFDSMRYVELSGLINECYGLDLAPTLFFDVHTPRAIAAHLVAEHADAATRRHGIAWLDADAADTSDTAYDAYDASPRASGGDIAIVGMAGVLPQSADLDAFWTHLLAGDDLISEVPPGRWNWRGADGDPATRWGGFAPRVDCFDAAFFGISPREAEQMDPQQRLLLQTAWAALEDAALRPSDLLGGDAAIFVGASTADYLTLLPSADGHLAIGNAHAMLANRLSHLLGTHGPSEAIDTACSSSLVALHRAVQALRRGESRVAIVGGVNLMFTSRLHRALAAAGMLSPDGRCKTFDASANGYVRGEGVVALVLMPLEAARAQRRPVLALVKGSAVNHGGRAAFLTAPDVNAQAALLEAAYLDAGVDPASVGYVEAHGTGTALGDPIEVQALRQGFSAAARRWPAHATPARCGIGSVKSNIGHLEAAAGLAGVAKVVLAMRHRVLPASLHCRELNPYLKLDADRFHVVTEPTPWQATNGLAPRAGVSSFGFGGANAHVVLEAAPAGEPCAAPSHAGPWFVPLSARSERALRARIAQLTAWLDTVDPDDAPLPALAKTLTLGRETMPHRFGITCTSLDDLRAQLAAAQAQPPIGGATPHAAPQVRWLAGNDAPLPAAWNDATPLLRLPAYPFDATRHWPDALSAPAAVELMPMGDGEYQVRLDPAQPLVADHRLAGEPVLAAAAQIVFARRAFEADSGGCANVALRDVEWLAPVTVGSSTEMRIVVTRRGGARAHVALSVAAAGGAVFSRSEASHAPADAQCGAVDLGAIRARCRQSVTADACYDAFAERGIDYGPSFRPLAGLAVGQDEVLADFDLNALAALDGNARAVALLDGAFQAISGLHVANAQRIEAGWLPAALARIDWHGEIADARHAWIRAVDTQVGRGTFDITLCDGDGTPRASLHSFTLASRQAATARAGQRLDGAGDHLLAPAWLPVPASCAAHRAATLTVLGGSAAQRAILAAMIPPPRVIDSIDALDETDAHVVWFASDDVAATMPDTADAGLAGFRLVKRLLALGAGARPLSLTVLTVRAWSLPGDPPAFPANADLAGLCGSLANEYPHWRVRVIDLPAGDALPEDWLTQDTPTGQPLLLHRHGLWFARRLVPLTPPPADTPPYRPEGVYVVIGGAGGLGRVWTEHVLRVAGAQVVWLGRRPGDAALDAHCAALAAHGPQPIYLSADAGDEAALSAARDTVLARFGRIDGVVHAAIVLRDGSLAQQDDAQFGAALHAQVATTQNLVRVFGAMPLDFLVFFSSLQSTFVAAGQGNYAAGCTFRDAFADWLRTQVTYPVKVVNWGFWGHTGVVATEAYRQRMAALGIGSIEPAAAMAALDGLLRGPLDQATYLTTLGPVALPSLAADLAGRVAPYTEALGRCAPTLPDEAEDASWQTATALLERAIADRLFADLAALRAFEAPTFDLDTVLDAAGIAPPYRRWCAQTLALLARHGAIEWDGRRGRRLAAAPASDAARAAWRDAREKLDASDLLGAHLALVDATLDALPEILQGRVPATSILFPDGDMHRVEAVYRRNAQADRCNRAVVDVVAQLLDDAPDARPAALLEIGAGTGGTTVPLIDALEARRARLEHYDFTDLSKAFLLNAKRSFRQGRDWLRYHLFDVEAALAPQALPPGGYDIVLATNVLHATQDIDVTLRNAKALLKTGGYLVINELLETHCFAHATFGLLSGWWRHRDSPRRLPGSPLLSRDGWTRALREAGFAVLAPASPDAESQGVIVAVSDGVIVQPVDVPALAPAAVAMTTRATAAPEGATHGASLRARCLHWLTQLVARTLKMSAGQLAADQPLGGYGVDSILMIGLTKSLRETFDIPLSNATLFEHATLDALTDFLVGTHRAACERVVGATAPAPLSEASPARDLASSGAAVASAAAPRGVTPACGPMPIAVIGMSGRYAQADDLHAFWAHLRDGHHCITEVPADRWDWRTHFDPEKGSPGRTYSRWGGFLTQIDRFDAGFFHIAPNDAAQIDPQARLFLEESWAAIENAGYTPASLAANRQVGVFVGAMNGYYPTGAQFWGIANRVSHLLDFHGPSLAVDTACSSSLTALHLAIESLRAGGCECAIAGGVNLIVNPRHLVGLSSLTMLSAGDTCRAFGAGADGFVDGEGVGALVLKPLARALEDGDAIHGVIRGSAINAGGKTHGLTVPNPRAQQAVVEAALARSGVPARAVSYIEAHGTGTALGDPIELAGLTRAFAAHTAEHGFCALGSVKSNIGHTESAAGIAGVTKVLLQMKHRELVPTLHADEVNPDLDFSATPFTLQHRLQAWAVPDGQARLAGVSSFGAGGANAHVVLEEFVEQRALGDDTYHPALVVLSAATESALRQRAARLLEALERGEIAPRRLRDLAFTLQTGRVEMAWRFACVATSTDALRDTLIAYLARNDDARWHAHHVDPARPGLGELDADPELRASIVAQCVAAGKFDKLAALWSQGLGLDWSSLAPDTAPRARLHLPTYPFEGERHWLDEPGDGSAARPHAPLAETASALPADAPRDVGTVLRGIVAQVLGYPDVALSESFFSLGGDSIRAVRAHRRLQQSLGIEIPLSLLLDAGTLAECVAAIEALPAAVPVDVPAAHDARPSTLSSHQQQFFFLDRLNPGNPAFNLPGALRVDGPWHWAAFEATYQSLIDAHDVLRTRFVVHDGEPRAEVVAHRRATVERHDLSALLPAHQAARIDACLTDASRTGFVLEQGDLSRVTVLELGDEAHIVLMNLHHIVGDVVSLATLLRTLAQASKSGVAPALPRPRRQYADWAADEQAQLPARVAHALPYWLDRLHHLPRPLPLPCDRPRPPVPSYRGRSVPLAFPPELAARLDVFCRERNVSRFVVMLAAFKVALRVLSGQDDIVVGSPYANRADEDSADMIGCLAYALVMRTRLDTCETFDDAIARVRQTVLGAFDHQGVPYPRLVEALNPTRHGSANPLYQVMFNVIPMPDLPGGIAPLEVDSGWLDYDLFVRLFVADDTIQGVLQYSEDLFDRRTAADLAAYYADLLHTLLAYPSLPLAGLAAPATLAAPVQTIDDAMPPLRLEIASTFTDRPLASTLRYWGQVAGQPLTPNFAPYGQLFQTLYDPSSPFRANRHGMNVVLVRARDWLRFDADADAVDARAQLARYVDELADALRGSAPAFAVPTLVLVLPDDAAALARPDGDDAGHALKEALADLPGLDVVHWRELAEVYPVVDVFDPHADAAGHVPFTAEYYAAIASYVARTAFQRSGLPLGDAWNRLAAEIHVDAEDRAATPADAAARPAAPFAPPRDDADATLLAIFADALKTPELGIDDHFFDRGGHSILAINVVYRINDAFGASLSVADVFIAPTVRQLAARLRDAPQAPEYVELATAAVLPSDVAPLAAAVADQPRGLLLTGATGFVGRHLLRELLDRTDATIYCLVRAADAAQGRERLRRTLEHWSLWRPDTAARIVAVPGDLSRPRLGLSDADHARLCDAVDAIYHNGTSMNHLESFEMARRANVDGVIDLLRIAVTGRPKTFNYVSTLAVFSMEERRGEHVFTEASSIDGERHLASHGYTTSKWAGEHLTHLAAARGVPCNVFRLGLVTGDTEHGHYDALQSYYRLLKSCMLMGAAFDDFRYDLVITPVDYVAKALAHLGAKHMAGGKVFHLSSMQVTPMHVVFEMMNRQLAAPMRMLSHGAWLDALRTRYHQGDVLPIVPVVQWMMNLNPDALAKLTRDRHATTMIYDCTATQRELDEAGIVVPTFDDALLRRYLRGMCRHDDDLRPFVSADGDTFLHTQS